MHFLRGRFRRGEQLWRRWACVTVKYAAGDRLQVEEGSIGVAKSDAFFVELPQDVVVVGPDGEQIKPTRKFFVSTETFDPYHLLIDVEGVPLPSESS